jgi:ubiquinol oxidase
MSNALKRDESNVSKQHAEDAFSHHEPKTLGDKLALYFVKFLRVFADAFFAKRYGHRAVVLETVAAVPGMVSGAMLHLKSLRKMEDDHGWIKTLLDEAENERMHLMTFIEIAKPTQFERLLVISAQGVFYLWFLLLYLCSPKSAHRVVGYLEEEAVVSYSEYLKMIEKGDVDNVDAPDIAIDYWSLPEDATLVDVVRVVRADEMMHREVNHLIADKISNHKPELKTFSEMSDDDVNRLYKYKERDFV